MKFMKLGTRPDTFFTTEAARSISSDVTTDLKIQVDNSLYNLHKFPLLSKCLRLQALWAETTDGEIIQLSNFPGGIEAFETCAKFCYGITVTISALNIVPVRCAAAYLGMTDGADRGNLVGKLDAFLNSCILRRWKDTLVTLQQTRQYMALCEEFGITSRCIDALASMIISHCCKTNNPTKSRNSWAEDISELGMDLYWRVMLAVKSGGVVPARSVGKALKVYARKWLPNVAKNGKSGEILEGDDDSGGESVKEVTLKQRLLLEKIVTLLPAEKGSVSCGFLLRLLKAGNILNASASCKMELARRVGLQLDEATVTDLLIPSLTYDSETVYDVDIVMNMLEEFMLQSQSPPTSPPRERLVCERRRSRSAENVEFELHENGRRSSSASHGSKIRVAKLIDGYLQEIAKDPNMPMDKLIALAEAVPEFARADHDDLYRVVDIYLKTHSGLDKSARKKLCRILDCKKLSVEACMHAAQNEMLPLRMVVQVLFFEQARSAITGSQVTNLPNGINSLLAKSNSGDDENDMSELQRQESKKSETLRMRLEEDEISDSESDDVFMPRRGRLMRNGSSRFKAAFCVIPSKPKKMMNKIWTMNKSVTERN
ncbi:Phototropic-responsive NPH3 family protein [Rhynchospora pubera]|uniref:Phototropic-responsive NPH3 family protein n=1 Tax=Rhynchospora pubera TaxID=906938 RepID=A0AAV8FEK9_9POAL|nr:Phototropic-responsive NPH3 family protein [Rhynchospora pubera]KAJ4814467.1 Phototropic-responsive NPH3 family protein [Rhynchospora pubera]